LTARPFKTPALTGRFVGGVAVSAGLGVAVGDGRALIGGTAEFVLVAAFVFAFGDGRGVAVGEGLDFGVGVGVLLTFEFVFKPTFALAFKL